MSGTVPTTTATTRDEDRRFLREALALAARVERRTWPNPPVGAVVVRDGVVVGRGAHAGAGAPHAEPLALAAAGPRARGATLYCTLEPCRHHGRTPPCTDAILAAGIARVVIGVTDPHPLAGGGAITLREAGVTVEVGDCGADCLDLIWPFVASDCFARPYLELKTATSLDGRFTPAIAPAGAPAYLTGPEARAEVHVRRRWADLVLVGQATAAADRPRLDTRLVPPDAACPKDEPAAGCVGGRGTPEPVLARARWLHFTTAVPAGPLPAGAEVVLCPAAPQGGVDPAGLLAVCHDRGHQAILLEGGPRLAAAFLGADLVDRWVQYLAPIVCGGGATWPAGFVASGAGFHLTRCDRVGRDLRVVWDRRDFTAALRERTAGKDEACSPA